MEQFLESGSNRVYKTIDEIPKYLGDAFVAIEDERFYKHNGIDHQGILRAGIVGITSGNFSVTIEYCAIIDTDIIDHSFP